MWYLGKFYASQWPGKAMLYFLGPDITQASYFGPKPHWLWALLGAGEHLSALRKGHGQFYIQQCPTLHILPYSYMPKSQGLLISGTAVLKAIPFEILNRSRLKSKVLECTQTTLDYYLGQFMTLLNIVCFKTLCINFINNTCVPSANPRTSGPHWNLCLLLKWNFMPL